MSRRAFPDPIVRQYSVKAERRAGGHRRGRGRVASGRTSCRAASGRGAPGRASRTTGSRSRGSARPTADLRAAAARPRPTGEPLRWVAIESPEEAARAGRRRGTTRRRAAARRALPAQPRRRARRRWPASPSGPGRTKFGMTETEIAGGDRGRRRPGRPASAARASTSTSGRSSARSTRGATRSARRSRSPRCGAARSRRSTRSTWAAGSRSARSASRRPTPERFARELPAVARGRSPADRRPTRLAIEPGRALVARAGWLVARVLHVRDRGGRQVVLDAGMTELIRPALYGARHPDRGADVARAARRRRLAERRSPAATVGRPASRARSANRPTRSATHDLPPLRRGDLVAIADAGAYAASLGSTYNGRPRPPQVLLEPGRPADARPAARDARLRSGERAGTLASPPCAPRPPPSPRAPGRPVVAARGSRSLLAAAPRRSAARPAVPRSRRWPGGLRHGRACSSPETRTQAELHHRRDRGARPRPRSSSTRRPSAATTSRPRTPRRDARALMDQWGVGRPGVDDGLVILFDLDTSPSTARSSCSPVRGSRRRYLSDDERQAIYRGRDAAAAGRGSSSTTRCLATLGQLVDGDGRRRVAGATEPPPTRGEGHPGPAVPGPRDRPRRLRLRGHPLARHDRQGRGDDRRHRGSGPAPRSSSTPSPSTTA